MIRKVENDLFLQNVHLFQGYQSSLVFSSIVEGNTVGELWLADQHGDSPMALLWDQGNNVFYISGRSNNGDVINDFAYLVDGEIRESAVESGLADFKVNVLDSRLEPSLPALFRGISLTSTKKYFHTFYKSSANIVSAPRLEGVHFELIDSTFLANENLKYQHYVVEEIDWMWSSQYRFCEKGYGIAGVLDEAVIGWCTAEYVSVRKCGIGIETMQPYQGKGIATAMAARFVDYSLQLGIAPHWECDSEHIASMRVAKKVGFTKVAQSKFWHGSFV